MFRVVNIAVVQQQPVDILIGLDNYFNFFRRSNFLYWGNRLVASFFAHDNYPTKSL